MSKYLIISFVSAIALTGCAATVISKEVKNTDLSQLTIYTGEVGIMDAIPRGSDISGTKKIFFTGYTKPADAIMGAVLASIATGSTSTGIQLSGQLNAKRISSSESASAIDFLQKAANSSLGYAPELIDERALNGISLSPAIRLQERADGLISQSCYVSFSSYASGSRRWTIVISNGGKDFLTNETLKNMGGDTFKNASINCFKPIVSVFIDYAKGDFDGKFRDGKVRGADGQEYSGVYAKSATQKILLQVFTTSSPRSFHIYDLNEVQYSEDK